MILLAQSKYYSVRYCEQDRYYHVDLGQKVMKLSFCQLLALRKKANAIDMEALLDSDENPHGMVFLALCNNEHLFVLSILEVLDLRSLVQNTFAAMGLSPRIVPMHA